MYELKSLRNYEHKLPMSSLKKQHDYNAHSLKKTKSTHKTINKPNYSIKNSSTSMYRQNIDKVQIHDDLERKNPSFVSKISARNSPQSNVNSIQAYPNNLNKYMSSSVFQKMGQSIVSTTKKKPLENIFVHSNSNQENNILKSLAYGNTPLKQTSGNDRLVLNGSNKMYLKPSESEPQAPLDLKLTINESLIEKLIYYWSDFIDLEITIENKNSMYLCVKRCLKILDNFKYINLELFNDLEEKESNKIDASSICQSFNKALDKILKLQAISLVYLKFILSDFNYEGNIKTQVKRMIVSINEPLYLLIDIAIVNHINKSQEKQDSKIESSSRHKDFIDKFKKVSRYHRLYKSSQPSEALRNINKQLENSVFASKQFSNQFFKIGYFQPIHSICFEFLRNLDKYKAGQIFCFILNNVLFTFSLNQDGDKRAQGQVKNIVFALSPFGLNLSHVSSPFLAPLQEKSNRVSLILDLDETLVHFFYTPSGGTFLVRPYAHEFLRNLSKEFEIIIFTAAMKDYADSILNLLDKNNTMIAHRLYRQHITITNNGFVKDLSKVGRDLKSLIMVDNTADNFRLQSNNGLWIKTWTDDIKDTNLIDLESVLLELTTTKFDDVRTTIKKIKDEVNKRMNKNNSNPYHQLKIASL